MARQTAVEWLVEQLQAPCRGIPSHILEQAKQMEKEQMEDAYDEGKWSDKFAPDDSFRAYYNKQYERNCNLDYYEDND